MKKIPLYLTTCCIFFAASLTAQVKIGNNPTALNSNSLLELETTNKGLLLPRISLTSTNAFAPLSAHIAGMTVYNTATVSDITPGYYYNDGAKWVRLGASANSWNITGNAGTSSTTNFLGTTDNVPLSFRVNNINAGKIDHILQNTLFGYFSGNSLAAGAINNTGLGQYSLFGTTTGTANTAIGSSSLFTNTTGSGNTSIGFATLNSNTTGNNSVAIGNAAMYKNTTGLDNVGIGNGSLYSNATGNYNIGIGSGSLFTNTTGSQNTGLGYGALYSSTTSNNNVAMGYGAMFSISTGAQNVSLGSGALYNITTGSNNSILGSNTGMGITTGVNNTIIGANVTALPAALSNNIIIADGNGNRRINVDATGNVGIGTNAPANKLEITQGTAGNSGLRLTNMTSAQVLGTNASGDVVASPLGAVSPIIFVSSAADQSIPTGVWTKLTGITNISIDNTSAMTASRFTPSVAGYYNVHATAYSPYITAGGAGYISIYKNGAWALGALNFGHSGTSYMDLLQVTGIVYMNGSTDYLELYAYNGGTTAVIYYAGWSTLTANLIK
jgi:trimeric autotransporter adhesin